MAIGFALVVLDRFIINPLFPLIQRNSISATKILGLISAVLALTWGVGSVGSGLISDDGAANPS